MMEGTYGAFGGGMIPRHARPIPSYLAPEPFNPEHTSVPARVVLNGRKKKCSGTSFPKKSPQALHVLNHGWWQLAVGGWQLATGGWWRLGVVGGGWWLAVGGWRRLAVVGSWGLVAAGGWSPLAVGGGWWLAVGGGWLLAVGGGWQLMGVGGWRLAVPWGGP